MSIYPHRHDAKARIYEKDGILWVTHADLLGAEYEAIEDFMIVYLNGKFYELQGYANEPDAWWIEEVVNEDGEDADPETEDQ